MCAEADHLAEERPDTEPNSIPGVDSTFSLEQNCTACPQSGKDSAPSPKEPKTKHKLYKVIISPLRKIHDLPETQN